jgi:hypothetical protein
VLGTVSLTSGPLAPKTLNLGTDMVTSCRIIKLNGGQIWSHTEIRDCPTYKAAVTWNCSYVGTYVKHTSSGAISGGNGSQSSYTETIVINRDHFFTRDRETLHSTCFNYSCDDTESKDMTVVGEWTSANAVFYDNHTLFELSSAANGWSFTAAACP